MSLENNSRKRSQEKLSTRVPSEFKELVKFEEGEREGGICNGFVLI